MKLVTEKRIAEFKDPKSNLPKVDYNMNTRYFRVVDAGETLGAYVNPRTAVKHLTPTAELWEVTL